VSRVDGLLRKLSVRGKWLTRPCRGGAEKSSASRGALRGRARFVGPRDGHGLPSLSEATVVGDVDRGEFRLQGAPAMRGPRRETDRRQVSSLL
jgi:hypothetical protein